MKKKNQPDNIRHLQDYRKTVPSPPNTSRPPDASYGYSRESLEKPSRQVKKEKAGERKKTTQNKQMERDPKRTGNAPAKEKRGQPLREERKASTRGKKQAPPQNPKGRASNQNASSSSKALPPVLVRRKDKYRWVTVLLMVILVSICALIVGSIGRNAEISKIRLEIGKLEKQITEEKNKVKELKMKLETSNRTDYIEEKARRELGMDYIRDDQIVYIDVE